MSEEPLSPLAESFQRETESGLTFLIFGGPSEGVYVTLKDEVATYRYIDGAASDNRLTPESDSGTYELRGNSLILYKDGIEESVVTFDLQEPNLEGMDGMRYLLVGQGLTIGFAPSSPPLESVGR